MHKLLVTSGLHAGLTLASYAMYSPASEAG
jgi:hypothetical protein